MGDYDRKELESTLRARAARLDSARAAMRRAGEGMIANELAHLDNHPADGGSELHEQEVDLTTEVFLEEEERRIAEALHALELGTYGTCVDCGAEIPAARLRAVPEAVRCFECQRVFEARHRQANRASA